jgi:hypothetical protein
VVMGSHKFEVCVNVNKEALTFATVVHKMRKQVRASVTNLELGVIL